MFSATPIIVDGVVYIGDMDGVFRAIGLADGRERWKFTAPAGFAASAAMRDGRLYVGDSAGTFYCLDAANGKSLWTFDTGGEIDSSANFYRDTVLFGSLDFTLYCLRTDRGTVVWKHETHDEIHCCPTVVEDRAFVAGCDMQLHVIDLHDGHEVAAIDMESPTGSTPAVRGDTLYVGTEAGTFFAIDWKKATVRLEVAQRLADRRNPLQHRCPGRGSDLRLPRQAGSGPRPGQWKSAVDLRGPRADRRLAGRRRPAGVCRLFGWARLRLGSPHGQKAVGIRSRGGIRRLARRRRRANGHRQRGRGGILFWREVNNGSAAIARLECLTGLIFVAC